MEGYPKDGTREEMLQWLKEKAPSGTLARVWKNQVSPQLYYTYDRMIHSPYLNTATNLQNLQYIHELGKYATPEELLVKLPFTEISQDIDGIHLEDQTLMNIFGSLPPYHGDVTPTHYAKIDDFDINILQPTYPAIRYPEVPADMPDPHGRVQLTIDSLKSVEQDIIAKQQEFESLRSAFQATSDPLEKCKILTQLINLKFKVYGNFFKIQISKSRERAAVGRPRIDIVKNGYHSFLQLQEARSNWKELNRLSTDSKQLVFARTVGGLILFLLKQIPPEQILNSKNSNTIFTLIQTYVYQLGFTTYDMIAIGDHMKKIASELNEYLSYDFMVFDCENGGMTERCYRGILSIPSSSEKYRIIFTDVDNNAEITFENQIRLIEKYSTKAGGKRRKTRRFPPKKRKTRKH